MEGVKRQKRHKIPSMKMGVAIEQIKTRKTCKDGARPALFHISLYLCCSVVICVVLCIVCV
jgi:hypothetical protein